MSRIAKSPVNVPDNVQREIKGGLVTAKGPKGSLKHEFATDVVNLSLNNNQVSVVPNDTSAHARAMSGTARALVSNMVEGVEKGFEKKLLLVGVGYKAQAKTGELNLALGFSHPVDIKLPSDVSAVTPSPTEIIISGADKQKVGQIASEIRAFRPPEPYKGKGVRYSDETVILKETKKK